MDNEIDVLIEPSPQIAISKTSSGSVVFNVATIDDGLDHVEHIQFEMPVDTAKRMAKSILALIGGRHGKS